MWRCFHTVSAVFLFLALSMVPTTVAADDDPTDTPEKKKTVGEWFPPSNFYPRYIADPIRSQNALTLQWLADTEIPETGSGRFGLRLGGSLGIRRWHPEDEPDIGWQISFEGGFSGQFDTPHSWDNTGWDGFYGLYLSWMLTPDFGFRAGTQHNSSHIGDEYSERTGRKRIHYTREEGILGVTWRFTPRWRTYGEIGYGNGHHDEPPWRIQSGLEYVSKQRYWKDSSSLYAAIDIRTYQEIDWSTRVTSQAGLYVPVGNRGAIHRFAIELGTGRSVMGQFLRENETWLGVGWYYDW
jgi:hypothetical protein